VLNTVNPRTLSSATKAARAHPVVAVAVVAGTGAIRAWQHFDVARKRKTAVRYIGQDVAAVLDFPEGEPAPNVVHACHPRHPSVYVPVGNYNLYLLQDRVEETLRLMQDLGACEVSIQAQDEGTSNSLSLALGLPTPNGGVGVSGPNAAEMTVNEHESNSVERTWRTPEPRPLSFAPEEYLWVASDPTLQSIVHQRLERQIPEEHTVTLRSTKDLSITGSVAKQLIKTNRDLGVEFRSHVTGGLTVRVRFP